MASFKFYLDRRQKTRNGRYPIKIVLSHKSRTLLVSTGFTSLPNEWSEVRQRITKRNMSNDCTNSQLVSFEHEIRVLFTNLQVDDMLSGMDVEELRDRIVNKILHRGKMSDSSFKKMAHKIIEEARTSGTEKSYRSMLSTLSGFTDVDSLSFSNMTLSFLKRFEKHLHERGLSQNTIWKIFKQMKAVFNRARSEGVTSLNPFAGIKTPYQPTVKRSLSVDDLRSIMSFESNSPSVIMARDVFILSFMLIGVNYADLHRGLKIDRDRVVYFRAKTGTNYSIRIEPCMLPLIRKFTYNGLIRVDATQYSINYNLKKIFNNLTLYYARHSWATIACDLDIPIETISHALGHKIGSPITNIYIRFDMKKVDEANRKVLEYVFNPPSGLS